MNKPHFLLILAFCGLISSCQDELVEQIPKATSKNVVANQFERLSFSSPKLLEEAILSNEHINCNQLTRSKGFISLLSAIPSTTRNGENETYWEAFGYDVLVPNQAFAALLNPLGELEVNDTIYKINNNGTYYFAKEYENKFNEIYKIDSLGSLISDKLYQLSEGIYRYKTFPDTITVESAYLQDDESNQISTRATSEPNYNSFPVFNADRHTWLGKLRQGLFGNDKYYDVKFGKKRRVKGRLYSYHYVVYSESGVNGMVDKKNWIGWSKTEADELRIGWNNIILVSDVDDPSLRGIPKQTQPLIGNIHAADIPSIGRGNLIDIYIADIEERDLIRIVGESIKIALKKFRPSNKPSVQAAAIATRSKIYLIILNDIWKGYNIKSMTHTFSTEFNIYVTINPTNLPSDAIGWAKTLSKTLSQSSFRLQGGEAIICARLGNDWKGMKIGKEI